VFIRHRFTTYFYPEKVVQYVVTYFEVKLLGQVEQGLTNSESIEFAYFPLDKLPEEIDLINPNWLPDALDSSGVFIR
jgi:8-oxo-dGTP diphosphatase